MGIDAVPGRAARCCQGACCFVLERSLQLLVTAGRDAVVRLWNPLVPSQPQATLLGHKAPVLDVAVLPQGQLVVSFDLRGVREICDLGGMFSARPTRHTSKNVVPTYCKLFSQ